MKVIKAFRKEKYGLFIDLEDKTASVCVDIETGDILFDEGEGDDRYCGAAISAKYFKEFKISEELGDKSKLIIYFGNNFHVLGNLNNVDEAKEWIKEATKIIISKKSLWLSFEESLKIQEELKHKNNLHQLRNIQSLTYIMKLRNM